IALEEFEGVTESESLAAVAALTDVKTLATIARSAAHEAVARRALSRVIDDRALGSIARHATLDSIRRAAFERLRDPDEIEAAAEREASRRRARLTELADEAAAASVETDLGSARRRVQAAGREWKDLSAGIEIDPQAAARFAEAETRLAARDSDAQEHDARQRREALGRLNQLAARAEALVARPDLTLKAVDHALRDPRTALADVPPLPSRRDFEEI